MAGESTPKNDLVNRLSRIEGQVREITKMTDPAGGQAQGNLGCDRPTHPNLIGADRIVAKDSSVRTEGVSMTTSRVAVNGHGVIGRRMADAVRSMPDIEHSVSPESHATTGHSFVDLPPVCQSARIGPLHEKQAQGDLPGMHRKPEPVEREDPAMTGQR